jgi:hypothetical protein
MSCRHEQKHLLHNWSDRRYRDHPQSPRAVLRVRLDSGAIATKRTIFVAVMAHREDRKRFVVRADEKLRGSLNLKDSQTNHSGFVQLGREGSMIC